jgi:hypothetical protein
VGFFAHHSEADISHKGQKNAPKKKKKKLHHAAADFQRRKKRE